MIDLSAIVAQLDAHAAACSLEERAVKGLTACFVNEGGSIDGVALADIDWTFHSHRLTFRHPEQAPYLETRLDLRSRDGRMTGYYCLHTDLTGAITDGYLVFDPDRHP